MRALPREIVPVGPATLLGALATSRERDPRVLEALRSRVAVYTGARHVFLTGSAREGIYWLLEEAARRGGGPGEAILWHYNFFAVPQMARRAGLEPVFADAANDHGEPDPARVERLITPRTRVILVSHHFGRPSDMHVWRDIADRHGVAIVEDCAHAFGARFGDRSVGTFGVGGAFSLSLTKTLTGVAGGVVITDDDEAAARFAESERRLAPADPAAARSAIASALAGGLLLGRRTYPTLFHLPNRLARAVGRDPIADVMTEAPTTGPAVPAEPSAAPSTRRALAPAFARVALSHLPHVDVEIAARRRAARALVAAVPGDAPSVRLPEWADDRFDTVLNLVARSGAAEALRRHLLAGGFDTRSDYILPMTDDAVSFPRSHELTRTGVYLPIRSIRESATVERLAELLRTFHPPC